MLRDVTARCLGSYTRSHLHQADTVPKKNRWMYLEPVTKQTDGDRCRFRVKELPGKNIHTQIG